MSPLGAHTGSLSGPPPLPPRPTKGAGGITSAFHGLTRRPRETTAAFSLGVCAKPEWWRAHSCAPQDVQSCYFTRGPTVGSSAAWSLGPLTREPLS